MGWVSQPGDQAAPFAFAARTGLGIRERLLALPNAQSASVTQSRE
jgi:hypothetical protein